MIKQYKVVEDHDNIRIDKWLRRNKYLLPQGLIEKLLRSGRIKVNKKKVKSSFKVNKNDKIEIYNLNYNNKFNENKYKPTSQIIKSTEQSIIFNNDD